MYNKLFTKILDSSIWLENTPTRLVWITMLAAMDEDGMCQFASVGNLAHRARITKEEAEEAVLRLESPDPDSSDPDNEGRRIERVPGGWIVLNASKYRDLVTREVAKEKTRVRVARHREKKVCNGSVTLVKRSVTPSEAYTETEASNTIPPKPPKDNKPTSAEALFIAELFNRRPGTAWSPKEIKAFKDAMRRGVLTPENCAALKAYYARERAKGEDGRQRRDLATFLNNIDGEIDRARHATTTNPGASTQSPHNNNLNRGAVAGYREVSQKLSLGLEHDGQGDPSGGNGIAGHAP